MKNLMTRFSLSLAFAATAVLPLAAASYYPVRLDDPTAVYLTSDNFPVHADGIADDSNAMQQAIDKVESTTQQGIVFIPDGRYRISKTIYVWPGVRVIGYGAHRPVIFLGANTPGFQQGIGYMVFFSGARHPSPWMARMNPKGQQPFPGTVPIAKVIDASPGTFYSAMSNVNFEIGEGNPAAVGIRFHIAQHCFLSHMDFHLGSGLAALHDIGNEAEDLHFYGGQYGIITQRPSPGWQFTLLDSSFDGQRVAAIKEHEGGLTLIHDQFKNSPAAILIDPGYIEELWIRDSRFENITGPAITISNEKNPLTEINLQNLLCRQVPVLALFRESGKKVASSLDTYRVESFSHGMTMANLGATPRLETSVKISPISAWPAASPLVIRNLPARDTWVNLHALGAKGDGVTDDTAAIQKVIAEHSTIYVPSGRYLVSDTITLKPDTTLIGLHPSTTQFDLADGSPKFQGPGSPRPLLQTPQGGTNIVVGIGLYTNGINSRAVGALWMAGKDSLMDDVRFLGGHGTNRADGSRINPYNPTHSADPDPRRRWDAQYPSLWVTNGGGGTFADIWTPDTFAQAGMYISNTSTEGHVYELSSEHHVRNEIVLHHVANWEIDALQTEEEWGEGSSTLPLEISDSRNITFANYFSYRVVGSYQPFPYAIKITNSKNILFRNLHVYSDSKVSFDNSVFDSSKDIDVRSRELASLTITGNEISASSNPAQAPATFLASNAKVAKLSDGFFSISGAAVDAKGQLFFVDPHWQRIYRWSPATEQLTIVQDHPLDPVQLAFDRAGNLMVVSYAGKGTVYSFNPEDPDERIQFIAPVAAAPRPGMTAVIPDEDWRNANDFLVAVQAPKPYQYLSPDGSTFIPAGEDFVNGALYYGTKMADLLRGFSLAKAQPGRPFYVTDESHQVTYSASVQPDGTLTNLKLFAAQGGESVATDARGNVYLAAGNVQVYNAAGKQLGEIRVPERPIDLIFGGKDRRTLFILTHHALYSIQTKKI